jgi:hypothetical protein
VGLSCEIGMENAGLEPVRAFPGAMPSHGPLKARSAVICGVKYTAAPFWAGRTEPLLLVSSLCPSSHPFQSLVKGSRHEILHSIAE